ncbi:MAG TPA: tetratricopeptide repeat protein [Abditibacteriaceae bacterium]|jgi:tetratricopeptide (TPR) repeat protein
MKAIFQHDNWVIGGFALFISAGWMAPVQADFPKPIAPPKSEALTPIRPTASSPALPDDISKPNSKTALVNAAHRHLPLLIEQMLTGRMTPQRAWDEKLFSADDLLWLFEHLVDDWGGFDWRKNDGVRRELARLLTENGGDKLQDLKKLSPKVRLWLADYYMSVRDEKCVTFCESILNEVKAPMKDEKPLIFLAIERLAWHYAWTRRTEKAAQTWERLPSLFSTPGWFVPDAFFEAGRLWLIAGNRAKAEDLFAKVHQYDNGWATGMALLEQARFLMDQDKHDEARTILSQPIKGSDSELIRVALLSLLAKSYYDTGEWAKARELARRSIEHHNTLLKSSPASGHKVNTQRAPLILQWIDKWEKQPVMAPEKITIESNWKQENLSIGLQVLSARPIPLSIAFEKGYLKEKQQGEWNSKPDFFQEKSLSLTVPSEKLVQSLKDVAIITSPAVPAFSLRVPVSIKVNSPLRPDAAKVTFGNISPGAKAERTFTIRSDIPFRVISARTTSELFSVVLPDSVGKPQKKQKITVAFQPKSQQQEPFQCEIQLQTDVAGQESVVVPCSGYSQG